MRKNYFIILYAILLQGITSLVLLFSPTRIQVADLGLFNTIFPYKVGAALMLLSVLIAIFADLKVKKNKVANALLHLPQEFFLILTAISALIYTSLGHYADGVVRPSAFIFIDQLPGVIAAILYLVALFDYVGEK